MTHSGPPPLSLHEDRFARLHAIEWWDQATVERAVVLVVGAGALGNEVLKNLALLGVGHILVVDCDNVEISNLSRSVLFRESDRGRPKAEVAASAARDLCPSAAIDAIVGNVLSDVGLGHFRRADVVVGAVDNREARVFINAACARVGRTWVDGGIGILDGIVRCFRAAEGACYECTMGKTDWDLLREHRSCMLLGRRAQAHGGVPTTPTMASIVGALQAQEVVKLLHGLPALLGRGLVVDGAHHGSYLASYPIAPDCPWHEGSAPVELRPEFDSDTPLRAYWGYGHERLGGIDALDLSRELLHELRCDNCDRTEECLAAADGFDPARIQCPACGYTRAATFVHSIDGSPRWMDRTPRELGLPAWDILWARHGLDALGLEATGDVRNHPNTAHQPTAGGVRRAP